MSVYTDLSTRFTYKHLLLWSEMDGLAQNDKFFKDNGWADATVKPFFQAAAPTGWTQVVTQNDKLIRVVSGAGGGSGGSTGLSSTISLNHTAHSISTDSGHTHTLNHEHFLNTGTTALNATTGKRVGNAIGAGNFMNFQSGAGSETQSHYYVDTAILGSPSSGTNATHNHGGSTTGAQLTDLALAYVDMVFASKATSSGYTDMTSIFSHGVRDQFEHLVSLSGNDTYNFGRLLVATTVAAFGQAAAPTGWTKSVANDNKGLRVVSGTGGGTGGTAGFGSTIPLAHTHSITSQADHTHTTPNMAHNLRSLDNVLTQPVFTANSVSVDGTGQLITMTGGAGTITVVQGQTDSLGAGTTSAAGTHAHGGTTGSALADTTLAYFDVIHCSKNSAGAPTSYNDMTGVFTFERLFSYQRLTKLGGNDAYINYHQIPSGTVAFFFQAAAPASWTQLVTQNDKGLRVVSGGTGGTAGGTTAISAGLTLAHTHSISSSGNHTHTCPAHTHTLNTSTGSGPATPSNFVGQATVAGGQILQERTTGAGGLIPVLKTLATSGSYNSGSAGDHNHGGATGSLLSNVTLAYADVIMCSKN